MRRRFAALAAAVLAACAREAAAPPGGTTRDSAGIRIVEYPGAPAATRTFALSPAPLYRVGDDPDERKFGFVSMGVLAPDGSAVVLDQSSVELMRIRADGAVGVLARSGQSPSEVASVRALRVGGGDTLIVQDGGNRRILLFERDSLVSSVSTAADPAMAVARLVGYEHPDTALLVTESLRPAPVGGWVRGSFLRFALGTGRADTLGAYDFAEASGAANGTRNAFPHFGMVVGSGDATVGARSDLAELVWRGPDGRVRQILRWVAPRTYPVQKDLDDFMELSRPEMKRRNQMSDEQIDQLYAQQRALLRVNPSVAYPLFLDMKGDGDGGAWISEYTLEVLDVVGIPHWSVVAPDGAWLGEITLPDRFRLLDVRGDRVLGVQMDSLDVQSVAVYRLQGRPAAR